MLTVIHSYVETLERLEPYGKRFMEDWVNWSGNADISVNIRYPSKIKFEGENKEKS